MVGAVVGEYLGSAAGLGYLIQQAEGVFDVAAVFAGMFVLSAFVILIDMGVTLVERRLLVWRRAVAADRDGRQMLDRTRCGTARCVLTRSAFVTVTDLIVIRLPRAKRAW